MEGNVKADIIGLDINLILNPIFNSNKKVEVDKPIRYICDNKESYLEVIPKEENMVPGELEEKLFIGILSLMKKKGDKRKVITTIAELKKEIGYTSNSYNRLRSSLFRLVDARYKFKNTMYSLEQEGMVEDVIETTIFTIKNKVMKKGQKGKNKVDKRIKEVYEITLNNNFFNKKNNSKFYYNSKILLKIKNPYALRIYILVEKLRGNRYELNIGIKDLLHKIPSKYEEAIIGKKADVIKKAFGELKALKIISDFSFERKKPLKNSNFKIQFMKGTNKYIQYDCKKGSDIIKNIKFQSSESSKKNILDKKDGTKRKNIKRYESQYELTFLRALFTTLLKELHSLIEDNRKSVRQVFIVRTKGIKISNKQYIVLTVKADTSRRTTMPYLDFITCDADELDGEIKELMKVISTNPKNSVEEVVNIDDKKSFKSKIRVNYNMISNNSSPNIDTAFEDFDTVPDVLSILGWIFKRTMDNLNDAIDELDEGDKENFRRSKDTIELEDCEVRKKGRQFSFSNGIILDVLGYDDEEDEYDSIIASISSKIKRECKDDSIY